MACDGAAAINSIRLGCASVLEPDPKPVLARWIEETKVLEVVRYKAFYLDEFVVICGGGFLELADRNFQGIFAPNLN